MRDLAPHIHRQRMVIEGTRSELITPDLIEWYLNRLATVLGMVTLLPAVTHQSDRFGWAGWTHWETSGAHFYAWDEDPAFFSVDIYTCKAFDPDDALAFTKDTFTPLDLVAGEF